jgi:hypothetical protein
MHNGGTFLRCTRRVKDGKEHRYWNIVENRRSSSRRVIHRQVLYLGEINDSQKATWCRYIEVLEAPRGEVARACPRLVLARVRRQGRRPPRHRPVCG